MYNKVLVATDGSGFSHRALKVAVEHAKRFQSEILLLFVFKQPRNYGTFSGSSVEYSEEQIEEISRKIFEATIKDIDTTGVTINTKLRLGKPAIEIIEEANEDVDLIVMGNRGHGTVTGAVTGSVAQKVLRLASCPVLVVK